ncbi:acyl-CoA dehydrogenase family protein [Muricoccus radiodurans]|uniref:acyl-CoA dehydrogenase family protein n=1 Tax=Muricoccus radiodurans TaxID=2231721 RepID=UPI003CE8245D
MPAWEDAALLAFREEVRRFCESALSPITRRKVEEGLHLGKEDFLEWERALAARGWLVGHWPKEHGGAGWTPLQRYIFLEETTRLGAPRITPFGVTYVGPVIYTYGNDAQRARFLPGIRESRSWWCQGYSEPGAGSDLAALTTRAVRDGDHYRVTGQKTWTSTAQWADWMFCLVRTSKEEKPQDGISFLLIDMRSPGVTVRPIVTLDGCHDVNDVFLDEVRVHLENRVGEEGRGWTYAKFLLGNERMGTIGAIGRARAMMAQLLRLAVEVREAGRPIAEHPGFAVRYAELEIALQVLEAMCVRQLQATIAGAAPGVEANIMKLRSTQLTQAIAQGFTDLLRRRGLPYAPATVLALAGDAPGTSGLLRQHLIGRASTIFGGSAEIQRNVIAKTALGL